MRGFKLLKCFRIKTGFEERPDEKEIKREKSDF